MRRTVLCLTSLFLLACQAALAQDDRSLINDLPAGKGAAATQTKSKSKQSKRAEDSAEALPPVTLPNTDLIDDLSPEQKRAAAERAEGAGTRGMRGAGGTGMMMQAKKAENAIPDNLADALSRALHNSPAILVAEAKVRQAQAELNEVRQTVVHDLTVAFKRRAHNIDRLPQGSEDVREAVLEDEAKILYLLGAVGEHHVRFDFNNPPALPVVAGAKSAPEEPGKPATVAADKNPQQAMAGMMSAMMGMGATRPTAVSSGTLDNLPENVKSFLNKRIDLDFTDQPIPDVLSYLAEVGAGGEVDFVIFERDDWANPPPGQSEGADPDAMVNMRLKQITVAAALQALADLNRCAFIFRDYGILVLGPSDDPQTDAAAMLDSFRASHTPMIAPPRVVGEAVEAMDTATGAGRIIGPDATGANPPAVSPAKK